VFNLSSGFGQLLTLAISQSTLRLEGFLDDSTRPYYVILSHTWGPEEVSFQEIQSSHDPIRECKAGYRKIQKCCDRAAADGFEYAWIDTCCIDKTNSAELSEAINSMFRWYREAVECYAYLEDIHWKWGPFGEGSNSEIRQSRWFTRGWTLQELLAPATVLFFDQNWAEIGTKASLSESIANITSIPSSVLLLDKGIESFSVAQRMSWASKRQTTRIEDLAYCLFGIFDVSMPLVYGEGMKAFTRLQLEILRTSDDQSLFSWTSNVPEEGKESQPTGPLARSPADFATCGEIVTIQKDPSTLERARPFEMTNKGLRIELRVAYTEDIQIQFALLNCGYQNNLPHLLVST
jgi:hypothetical protein